jgi:hypothetical protein
MNVYTVHDSGHDSVVAACTTFDAAAARALEILAADISRMPYCFTSYTVRHDGAEVGRLGRDLNYPDRITFTPSQRATTPSVEPSTDRPCWVTVDHASDGDDIVWTCCGARGYIFSALCRDNKWWPLLVACMPIRLTQHTPTGSGGGWNSQANNWPVLP